MEFGLMALTAQLVVFYIISQLIIYIELRYQRNKSDDYMAVNIYLGKRIMLYSMKVPVIELLNNDELLWVSSEIKASRGKARNKTCVRREQHFIKKLLKVYLLDPRRFLNALRLVKYYAKLYRRFICRLVKSLTCEHLYWKTIYGSEDSAITGLMTGVLWSVKGMLITILRRRFFFTASPQIVVEPIFGQSCLDVNFQCIFSLRVGKIINAASIFVKSKGKGATTSGRTSYSRANENSYAKHKRYG